MVGKSPATCTTTGLARFGSLCEEIDDRLDAFLTRPIEGKWPYLWFDATHLKVRQGGRILFVAVAVGVDTDDRSEVRVWPSGPPKQRCSGSVCCAISCAEGCPA